MPLCNNLIGYLLGCRDYHGGYRKYYARQWSAGTSYSYDSNGVVTGSTNIVAPWYTFEQLSEKGEYIAGDGTVADNGAVSYTSTLNAEFQKYDAANRNLLYALGQKDMEVIVYTNDGKYFLMGELSGVRLATAKAQIGKALSDLNGSMVSLTARGTASDREVNSTFISTLTFA